MYWHLAVQWQNDAVVVVVVVVVSLYNIL